MATSGDRAFGTIMRYVPWSSAATLISEMGSYGSPERTADTIEMTSHDSTDRFREFLQGLRDGGEATLSGNAVPTDAGQAAILAHFNSATDVQRLEIAFPDGAATNFDALCTAVQPVTDADVESKLEFSATLKVTGEPEWGVSQSTGLTTPFFALSDGDGTVSPAKASDTYFYTAEVVNLTDTITVTPTSSGADTIYVQEEVVASGAASSSISLDVGENVIVIVTELDGYRPARYEITVTRAAA